MTGGTGRDIDIFTLGYDQIDEIDRVMHSAFDARYGEAWTPGQVLATLSYPGYRVRGAKLAADDDSLGGFAISRTVMGESELLLLGVDSLRRRSGFGFALMQDWHDYCRDNQVDRMFLEMREDNTARFLYEKCGFSDLARRKAYYHGQDGIIRDAITMECNVT